ncbi:uncharacterized protein LOC129747475 [Uranotaenia lowii]|uniref:uncharacterized protein LOC129747475 n=1 Tax=Uranotaenia lowii TaxID=190385 RepID=UPI002478C660|nr:uncharacterized protein LOC129747475 [Uranotaenia lowii]
MRAVSKQIRTMDQRRVYYLAVLGVVAFLGFLGRCEGVRYGVVCRVKDTSVVQNCNVLKDCMYEVYPVETAQNSMNAVSHFGNQNKLFALYGGPSSCAYFFNLIKSQKGQQTLVDTISKLLQKSGYRGLDLQCDPSLAMDTQQDYSDFLANLRSQIGGGYIISVTIRSATVAPCIVSTLNNVVDLINVPVDTSMPQLSAIESLVANGLQRHKVVLDIQLPNVVNCPCESGTDNLFAMIRNAVHVVETNSLFGASLQLDKDDAAGVCAKGRFPLFSLLVTQLGIGASHAAASGKGGSSCAYSGFVRDTRDCSRFYTCNQGVQNQNQCPAGKSFDLCSSTCQPTFQVNCNQTTCSTFLTLDGGNRIPIAIPYPFPIPGASSGTVGSTGGMGGTGTGPGKTEIVNITNVVMVNNQTSELLKLLNATDLEQTVGVVNTALKDVYPPLKDVVDQVNTLLKNLLLGNNAMNSTMSQMDGMNKKLGLLESILDVVVKLLKNLLGLDLGGLLGGGGGGGSPLSGVLGGGGGGASPTDALGALTGGGGSPLDAVTGLAGGGGSPLDAVTGLAGGGGSPLDAVTGLAGGGGSPLDAVTGLAGGGGSPLDAVTGGGSPLGAVTGVLGGLGGLGR